MSKEEGDIKKKKKKRWGDLILLYPARTHVSCIQVGDLGEKKSILGKKEA